MDDDLWRFDESWQLHALMENIADSIYFKDRQCRLIKVSRKMAVDLGYKDPAELVGKTYFDLFGVEFGQKTMIDDLQVMEAGEPLIGLVESRSLADGGINWTSTSKLPLRDDKGVVIGLLGITREINELKRVEQDLQFFATHDILTSLPNRFLLYDRMEQMILRSRRNNSQFAVLYIDLDKFKAINDRHGHDAGDEVLKQVAARLTANVRECDTVARMGGDEFAVVLDAITKPEDSMAIAQKIREKLEVEFRGITFRARVTASIGISIFPIHGVNAVTLLKAADHAMYKAKKKNNACLLFSSPPIPNHK